MKNKCSINIRRGHNTFLSSAGIPRVPPPAMSIVSMQIITDMDCDLRGILVV